MAPPRTYLASTYLAIDLKSFYASVECVDRHLDPLTTNLVVADASRTEKTICLAVSPSLKAYKIPGRARLFEAVQRVREVNAQRLQTAIRQKKAVRGEDGKYHFASTSFDANALNADPALGLSYIVAPPRMQRYLDVSTQIYKTYLKYVSPADIYPYSIDEVFIDVTGYLPYYHMSAHELAMTMVREVLYNTGITATAGIGTNLYLAKLAMDIVAKHIPADKDGVRIAELDEILSNYTLIEEQENHMDMVHVGNNVVVKDLEFDETLHYQIVGSQEADPMNGRISEDSPFGRALLGKKAGEEVVVEAPAGNIRYQIVEIQR